jgi:hypothetical protein
MPVKCQLIAKHILQKIIKIKALIFNTLQSYFKNIRKIHHISLGQLHHLHFGL